MNFAKFLRTPFVHITSGRLLLWTTTSETSNTKYLQVIKRSKFQEKNMSCERALNFDQRKTFSANYKSMRVWLWLAYKFTENCQIYRLFFEFIQTKKRCPTSWQNTYPNSETTCHIKLNFFLWTQPLKNLLLAKYLISVAAPLRKSKKNYFEENAA